MDNLILIDKIQHALQSKYNLVKSFYTSKYSTPQERSRIVDMFTTALDFGNITANEYGMEFKTIDDWKVIYQPIKKEN